MRTNRSIQGILKATCCGPSFRTVSPRIRRIPFKSTFFLLIASILILRVIYFFSWALEREIAIGSSSNTLLKSSEWNLDHWRGQSALASFVLWQTYKTSNRSSVPRQAREAMATWMNLNSDLATRLVGDPEAEAFINLTFTREVAETYQKLPLGVMKADFWRYAVLYARGGIYADVDATCAVPIRKWLPPIDRAGEELPFETEYNNMTWDRCSMLIAMENDLHFCQWALASAPRHPLLHYVLRTIMERVGKTGGIDTSFDGFVHHYTGPGVWTDAIISFLNLPGVTKAEDVLVKIFSDKRAYKKAQKYGLCIVGPYFFRAINVKNLFASQGFTDGWESWTVQRDKFFPSPPSPLPLPEHPELPVVASASPVQFHEFFFRDAVARARERRERREHPPGLGPREPERDTSLIMGTTTATTQS